MLQQPQGEPEYNMKELQATWEKLMAPAPAAAASSSAAGDVVEGVTKRRISLPHSKAKPDSVAIR